MRPLLRKLIVFLLLSVAVIGRSDDLAIVYGVPRQPLSAATDRLIEALEFAGSPLTADVKEKLRDASKLEDASAGSSAIQSILDSLCLAQVHINPESRVKVKAGPAKKQLTQHGWRAFLVKVHNEAGINPELFLESPNSLPVYQKGRGQRQRPRTDEKLVDSSDLPARWLDSSLLNRQPMTKRLSGLAVEYRVLMLYSRDAGPREASLSFHIGAGTQDIGFRNAVPVLFDCQPGVDVRLSVKDTDGSPAVAGFTIRDAHGRVYPNPAKRLAPDFFFHHQIYRGDGESIVLPPGDFQFTITRGPEYVTQKFDVVIPPAKVPPAKQHSVDVQLRRWIHMADRQWYSGDHHIHAAGCAHYDSPTEGVGPADMMRHVLGEDLNVGCVLSWGPCWYTQKQFFEGQKSAISTAKNLMRYDVEVSGFPSSHAGHLCLLNLTEDDYPGTETLEQWPSWTLPVLKWGQDQGGIVGYSHSGWGLALPDHMPDGSRQFVGRPWGGANENWPGKPADRLPDYAMPRFDGIGANEFVVAAAHNVCDFISAVDTPAIWELNVWYHTLNCGMTSRISGETDFPCIYDDRVGLGRVYVKLDDELNYQSWVEGLRDGRSYCGDGMSHIVDFKVDGFELGTRVKSDAEPSRLDLSSASEVTVSFDVAAMLQAESDAATERIRNARLDEKPYWHIERSRIGETREVLVEVIVNGVAAASTQIKADGSLRHVELPVSIEKSSWIAVRIFPSVHTNPIFVHVDGKPIRADAKSAQWCIDAVKTCWESKQAMIREDERGEARKAYDQARAIYEKRLAEH